MTESKSQPIQQFQDGAEQGAQCNELQYTAFTCPDRRMHYRGPGDSLISSSGGVSAYLGGDEQGFGQHFEQNQLNQQHTVPVCADLCAEDYTEEEAVYCDQEAQKQVEFAPASQQLAPADDQLLDHDTILKIVSELKILKEENQAIKAQLQTRQRASSELAQLTKQLEVEKERRREAEESVEEERIEKRELQAKISANTRQIVNLTQYNEAMENKNFALKAELDGAEEKRQEAVREAQCEREESGHHIADLEGKYALKLSEIEALNLQIRELKQEGDDAQNETQQLKEKLEFTKETARQQLEERIQNQYSLVREFNALKKQSMVTVEELQIKESEIDNLEKEVENLQKELEITHKLELQAQEIAAEKSALETQIEEEKNQFSELCKEREEQLTAKTQEIDELQELNEELARQIAENEDNTGAAAREESELVGKIRELSDIISKKDREIDELNQLWQSKSDRSEKTALASKIAEETIIIDTLREKVKSIEKDQNPQVDERLQELSEENETLLSKVKGQRDLSEQLLEMQRENVRLSEKVISEQQRVAELKTEREISSEQLEKAKKQIVAANHELTNRELMDEQRELENKAKERLLKQKEEIVAAMDQEIKALQIQLAGKEGLDDRVKLLQNKLIIAENDLKNRLKENNADAFRQRVKQQEAKINELLADNKALTRELERWKEGQFESNEALAFEELTDKLITVQTENEQLQFDLEEARIDINEAESKQDSEAISEETSELKKTYEEQLHELKKNKNVELEGLRQVILKQEEVIDGLKKSSE